MSFPPPIASSPPGWYPHPYGDGLLYFDGHQWRSPTPQMAAREAHPDLPLVAAIGALVVLVVSLVASKVIVDALVGYEWPLVAYVAILAVLGYGPSIVWILVVRHRWGDGRLGAVGWGLRWSDLGWGPLTWLGAVGVQIVLALIVLVLDIPLTNNVDDLTSDTGGRAYVIAIVVTAVVVAPLVEEMVFRGLIMRGFLSRMAAPLAIVLQAILFGSAHIDPVRGRGNLGLSLVLAGVGAALGVSAYLTRRLGPSIVAHALFNGVVLVILLTGVFDNVDTEFGGGASTGPQVTVVDQAHVTEPGGGQDARL